MSAASRVELPDADRLAGWRGRRGVIGNHPRPRSGLCRLFLSAVRARAFLVAGVVRAREKGISGEATIDFIRQFKVDFGVIRISSVESGGTLRHFDHHQVCVADAIVAQSPKVYLVADHSELGRAALVWPGHLSQVDSLFTDQPPSAAMVSAFADAGRIVRVAPGFTEPGCVLSN